MTALLRRLTLGDLDLTAYPFAVEFGADLGAPGNVYDTLISMLADGDISASDRVSNREVKFNVLVEGATLAALAASEATLILECDKQRNLLSIEPGDGAAATSVFETFRIQARLQYDDNMEQETIRRYELTIPARPYVRGAALVTTTAVDAPTTPPAETVLYDGTSATGWQTVGGGAPTVVSGTLVSASTNPSQIFHTTPTTINLSTGGFLAVDWKTTAVMQPNGFRIGITQTGVAGSSPNQPIVYNLTVGTYTRSFVYIPPGMTAAKLSFIANTWSAGTLTIDKISRWNKIPDTGTSRQRAMSLVPGGSVRTQGSIQVSHATNSLGKTIVYTHPSGTGYLPPLSPWRVSGDARTTEAGRISGSKATLTGITTFNVPVVNLPRGRVEVWAWLWASATTPFTLHWSVFSYMGSTNLTSEARSSVLSLPGWTLVPLGETTLPPTDIGTAGYVRVDMQRDAGSALTVYWDEAYLFATDEGRLTVVDCATGTAAAGGPSNRLWVDAPSLTQPQGGVWRGNASDRSDAWHAGSKADVWEVHNFSPTGTNVFVATANTDDPGMVLEHYQNFHTHTVAP